MSNEKTFKFSEFTCAIKLHKYQNNRTAIQLIDAIEGDPVIMATVNIPEIPLDKDEVIIKNYSENEGILNVLVAEGIVERTGKAVEVGYNICEICKLL